MEQRQMEQTLTGLLLTAAEQLRDLEPYGNWHGKPEGIENQENILRMANTLCELWGIGSGARTILEDLRLEKIVRAIAALGFTDEEVQKISEFSWNTQDSLPVKP